MGRVLGWREEDLDCAVQVDTYTAQHAIDQPPPILGSLSLYIRRFVSLGAPILLY